MRTAGPSSETRRLVRINCAFSAAIPLSVAGIGAAAWPLLEGVYGEAFTSARGGISWYLIAAVFAAPASTIGTALIASGMHRSWLALTALWWVTLLLLVSSPVGQGFTGAGVAMTASYALLVCAAGGVGMRHALV
jgi:O-antigen/teichoic acid export membrane protein